MCVSKLIGTLTAKHRSSDNVPNQRRDDALPDVQSNRDLRRSNPDGHGDKGHIGDNVIESQRNEPENGPPDTHQLRGKIAALQSQETSHTDQPIAANSAQENHAEIRGDLFLVGEGDDFRFVGFGGEDVAIFFAVSFHTQPMVNDRINVQPKIIATTNNEPARFPQNVTNQCTSMRHQGSLRCNAATVVNRNELVQRSAPVRRIIDKPYGKIKALTVRINPGALPWYHEAALVLSNVPQAKANKLPAKTELKKTLSKRLWPFAVPVRLTAATTSAGESASSISLFNSSSGT